MKTIKKMIDWFKTQWDAAMTQKDVNSRIVFLVTGMIHAVSVLILTIAFVHANPDNKIGYPTMVIAVSGGGLGAAVGRAATKATAKPDLPQTDKGPES